MELLASNIEVDGGEIDLLMTDGAALVAVEVRAITGDGDPIDAVSAAKRAHVERVAATVGARRSDFVGVGFRTWGVEVHWLPE